MFRLHGAPASCFAGEVGSVRGGACNQAPSPVLLSYYEDTKCQEGIAPGCANAEPYLPENYVWFVAPEPGASSRLVLCAGLCSGFRQSAGGAVCVKGFPSP